MLSDVLFLVMVVCCFLVDLDVIKQCLICSSFRSFKKALHDVIMSRRAIRNMNTL